MSKSTMIAVGVGAVVTFALGGWLVSGDPLPRAPKIKTVTPLIDPSAKTGTNGNSFKFAKPKATALNNEPVNIVITPGNQSFPVPVNTGTADLIVNSSSLRMRAEPTSRSETIHRYKRGARFVLFENKNGWVLVQSLEDGQKGWMFKKYMKAGG